MSSVFIITSLKFDDVMTESSFHRQGEGGCQFAFFHSIPHVAAHTIAVAYVNTPHNLILSILDLQIGSDRSVV